MVPEIAIIEPNTLTALGLEHLLEEVMPQINIRVFPSFEALVDDTPDMFVHYFVSSKIYFEHTAFFLERKHRAIVLTSGESPLSGIISLDINQNEQQLAKSILQLMERGHGHPQVANASQEDSVLSLREIEVLRLVVQGYINKEIADKLNISLTTVITHRKNITEKLGIKSVSGLTIYAVMQGLIEANAI